MKTYNYNKETGEFIGLKDKQLDPLESRKQGKKVYLMPANCTDVKPPRPGVNEVVCWDGSAWNKLPDYRGAVYYNISTKEKVVIREIGVEPGAELTDKEPDDMIYDEWNGSDWVFDQARYDADQAKALRSKKISLKMVIDAGNALGEDMTEEQNELNELLGV